MYFFMIIILVLSMLMGFSAGYKVYSFHHLNSTRTKRNTQQPQEASLTETLSSNVTRILEGLLKDYDKTERPDYVSGNPTEVKVNMLIRSMGPISEADMFYSMDCYFRQYWTDTRLSFKGLQSNSNNLEINQLSLNVKMLEKIWKPDTYFLNGLNSYLHTITRPNKLLRISEHGFITYSMRLTIKAKCPMMLSSFPMDWQSCPLILGSFAYPVNEVQYKWQDPSAGVGYEGELHLSQFDIKETEYRNVNYTRKGSGTYSVLQVVFLLQRHTGYFLIQVYVPCTLIVILSWVGFWLNREATSDRVGLGITAVLTLSTIALDSRTDLPKVHYATALDWFIICSFGYCMATLLEFAGVHYFTKIGSGEVFSLHDRMLEDQEEEEAEAEEREREREEERDEKMINVNKMEQEQEISLIEPTMDSFNRVYGLFTNNMEYEEDINQTSRFCHVHNVSVYNQMQHIGSNGRKPGTGSDYSQSSFSMLDSGSLRSYKRPVSTQTEPKPSFLAQLWLCILSNQEFRKKREKEARKRGASVNSVSRIDIVSRALFPFSFLCFNILYWISYFQGQIHFDWKHHDL
ncbi:gamma-aminobutyric acid receptor alpha-like [Eurytemora carolleeae]|uniref:gamma-aminobutyric acid receptor alpha-like n=1 Tax=Eurytemora carolleeae TaxID=1294199 RepID=UPI000C762D8A|nr:gamma-aminobutyric acid receptor alpha-like [Eurytemora carolleeae]|eukprot:XP_023322271.1 gamma-aminobutyric acid receptor alpha-like [Eurytemora affinis]